MLPFDSHGHTVVFFDGVCNLCNNTVQFIIRNDRKGKIMFCALQTPEGAEARTLAGLRGEDSSLILLHNGKYYTHSTGALRIAGLLGGFWPVLSVGLLVPRFVRDAVYRFIAANRYRWFGKKTACMIPTPALKARFIG
ncbi:MAG: DUF393 domain-containing protein [Chitinophagia bacterium]|nr:DUF393 domain-containing protein [Chitinophagia bacterium]